MWYFEYYTHTMRVSAKAREPLLEKENERSLESDDSTSYTVSFRHLIVAVAEGDVVNSSVWVLQTWRSEVQREKVMQGTLCNSCQKSVFAIKACYIVLNFFFFLHKISQTISDFWPTASAVQFWPISPSFSAWKTLTVETEPSA